MRIFLRYMIMFLPILWLKTKTKFRLKISFCSKIGRLLFVKVGKFSDIVVSSHFLCRNNVTLKAEHKGRIIIGDNVFINSNTSIVAVQSDIIIGDNTLIGDNVTIINHNHLKGNNNFSSSEIVIGHNVWIGSHCVILEGVAIGDNCIIAAGSVITKSIPKNTKVIQKRVNSFYENL